MCLDIALHIALLYRRVLLHLLYTITIKKHFITIAMKVEKKAKTNMCTYNNEFDGDCEICQ